MTENSSKDKEVAEKLYLALVQMKHRRGIHIDDIEIVLDAMDMWEDLNGNR